VAAPTAGLHFTPEILNRVRARGVEIAEITLDVGLGTFEPVRTERLEDHKIHEETYEISEGAAQAIASAKSKGRPVLAIGTTVVRALEDTAEKSSGRGGAYYARDCGGRYFYLPGEADSHCGSATDKFSPTAVKLVGAGGNSGGTREHFAGVWACGKSGVSLLQLR
jgi:hypothetical protein